MSNRALKSPCELPFCFRVVLWHEIYRKEKYIMLLKLIKFVYDISTDYVMSHAKQILAFSLIMLAFALTISLVPINVYFGYALILIILTFSISAEIAKRFNKN